MKIRMSLAALASSAAVASAQPHGGDIVLQLVDSKIATAICDDNGQIFPACTFEGEMAGGETDEPGFDSGQGEFPDGCEIGFTIRRALREWAAGTFETIPDERLAISWGPFGPVTTPTDDTPVEGFPLGVSAGGEFHCHYDFVLSGPAEPGVYLLELGMWSDRPEIGPSEPLYIVFNNGMDEVVHEEAIAWWEANRAWCTAQDCVADFNGDGVVDTRDVIVCLNAWTAGDPAADTNGDGAVDSRDVIFFLNLWTTGC
ncbi:MAG TPA: GC-type dockerin domain-anchored protein [Phycisphaerales bacterium]|nr:GC-type dockerin domain-anchored protein [Phycisphaerales bacterium]